VKQTLLIADGDSDVCDLYRQLLTHHGYEVETTSNGLDCLGKLRQLRPAALVLDLKLLWGGSDGVLDWIREENFSHAIPVILTGTVGDPQPFAEFSEPPVMSYLPKPFALTALLESVRFAISRQGRQETWNLHRVPAHAELFIG
jgi:DNA-binding NtrC family response regulator